MVFHRRYFSEEPDFVIQRPEEIILHKDISIYQRFHILLPTLSANITRKHKILSKRLPKYYLSNF